MQENPRCDQFGGKERAGRSGWRSRFSSRLPLRAAEPQPQMTGDVPTHDPSVIEIGGQFVAVGTGQQGPTHGAIRVKTSPDGVRWTDAGLIGQGPPAWARTALGFRPSNVWAPSISRHGNKVFLYTCLSGFGHNTSAIGLMTMERGRLAGTGAASAIVEGRHWHPVAS